MGGSTRNTKRDQSRLLGFSSVFRVGGIVAMTMQDAVLDSEVFDAMVAHREYNSRCICDYCFD